jgi:small-conductance mechanosensitive channel
MFDKDSNGTVSLREMQTTITRIFKDRRNLSESMSDLSHALGQLNHILYGISFFVTMLFALPIFGVSLTSVIPLTSFFLGLSFIFSGVAQQTFAAIIFIFVTHPYDSGDKVIINDKTYFVVELSLLITTLRQEGKIVYIPNSQLALQSIYNIRRSGDQAEMIKICVCMETPEEAMQNIFAKMVSFMKSQPGRFRGTALMEMAEFGPGQSITYGIILEYNGNWQDGSRRIETKSAFMAELKKNLDEQHVKLYHPYMRPN